MFHALLMDFPFGPLERRRILIPLGNKGFDGLYEHLDTGEACPLQGATAQDAPAECCRRTPNVSFRFVLGDRGRCRPRIVELQWKDKERLIAETGLSLLSNAKLNATRSALFATEAKSIMIARGSVPTDD